MKSKRTYHIILTNHGSCCSDMVAKTSVRWIYGPRCPMCNTVLGPMQWRHDGTIRANYDLEALRIYLARRKVKTPRIPI